MDPLVMSFSSKKWPSPALITKNRRFLFIKSSGHFFFGKPVLQIEPSLVCLWRIMFSFWNLSIYSWNIPICSCNIPICSWNIPICSWNIPICSWNVETRQIGPKPLGGEKHRIIKCSWNIPICSWNIPNGEGQTTSI